MTTEQPISSDTIAVLETNIDNMSGELIGALLDRLLQAGALDVTYTPIQMKKNRPATQMTVLCHLQDEQALALLLLRETSTLGVRVQHMQRYKADRFFHRFETPLGSITGKVKVLGKEIIAISPEYEDCLKLAQEHRLPLQEVYNRVQPILNAMKPDLLTLLKDEEQKT